MLIKIIALISATNLGDDNNAKGTQFELQQQLQAAGHQVECREYDYDSQLEEVRGEIADSQESSHNIVLAAGVHTLETLAQLKQEFGERIYTSWSSHQYNSALLEKAAFIDSIALPSHVLDETLAAQLSESGARRVISTIGVPHNLRIEDIAREYYKWTEHIINAKKYDVVILGGDAPDSSGSITYYTAEEGHQLGIYIGRKAIENDSTMLATNGPRTGQHPIAGVREGNNHTAGNAMDSVSAAFIEGLRAAGLPEESCQFIDFKKGQPSAYKAFLEAVKLADGQVYMPGESTSMISETTDMLEPNQVIIYDNNAMNSSHHQHVQEVCALGWARHLTYEALVNGQPAVPLISDATLVERQKPHSQAAATLARAIIENIPVLQAQMPGTIIAPESAQRATIEKIKER